MTSYPFSQNDNKEDEGIYTRHNNGVDIQLTIYKNWIKTECCEEGKNDKNHSNFH